MDLQIYPDMETVAKQAAALIAAESRAAVSARGQFVIAVSGGRTPWVMLRALADEDMPWQSVYVAQVDERIAPAGHPDRNLTHLQESLLRHAPLPPEQLLAMPIESPDPDAAAQRYVAMLEGVAGSPPVLDLVHLGLGPDGHTASLVPNDSVLGITDHDVAITGVYQGRRRMNLTYPIINRSRRIMWLVTGTDKQEMLRRLLESDKTIPAGNVNHERALILADAAATGTSRTMIILVDQN